MKIRITDPQFRALGILFEKQVSYTTWGGEVWSGMPDGIKSRATLNRLFALGLAGRSQAGTRTVWDISREGRIVFQGILAERQKP